jgi:hypothetical protein
MTYNHRIYKKRFDLSSQIFFYCQNCGTKVLIISGLPKFLRIFKSWGALGSDYLEKADCNKIVTA